MASRVSTWAAVRTCNGSHQNVPIVPAMGNSIQFFVMIHPFQDYSRDFQNFNTKQCLSPKRAVVRRFWQNVKIVAWFLRGFLGQETAYAEFEKNNLYTGKLRKKANEGN
jgi:hypothetical protein